MFIDVTNSSLDSCYDVDMLMFCVRQQQNYRVSLNSGMKRLNSLTNKMLGLPGLFVDVMGSVFFLQLVYFQFRNMKFYPTSDTMYKLYANDIFSCVTLP